MSSQRGEKHRPSCLKASIFFSVKKDPLQHLLNEEGEKGLEELEKGAYWGKVEGLLSS